jgi:hypothetical protein
LSHITYCDAAGVRFLLTAQKQAHTTGRDLVVRHPSRPVRRILTITGELSAIYPADPLTDNESAAGRPCATPPRRTHHLPEAHSPSRALLRGTGWPYSLRCPGSAAATASTGTPRRRIPAGGILPTHTGPAA